VPKGRLAGGCSSTSNSDRGRTQLREKPFPILLF
jgi:hypothetical protein